MRASVLVAVVALSLLVALDSYASAAPAGEMQPQAFSASRVLSKLQAKVLGDKDKLKVGKKKIKQLVDATAGKTVAVAGGTGGPVFSCVVSELHPTQFAVGYEAVKEKRKTFAKKQASGEFDAYLQSKPIPVVEGPGNRLYLIDHHHLSRALFEEKIQYGICTKLADWSDKKPDAFWKDMEAKKWVYMKDEDGKPITWRDIPRNVGDLADNPYRSLAGFVREAGGFSKTTIPFTEFFWADFYRKYITKDDLKKFKKAVEKAMTLAKSPQAKGLPGYAA